MRRGLIKLLRSIFHTHVLIARIISVLMGGVDGLCSIFKMELRFGITTFKMELRFGIAFLLFALRPANPLRGSDEVPVCS